MRIRIAIAALLLATLAACAKVTPANYSKVENGMTRAEVYKILGDPDEAGGGGFGPIEISAETWKGPEHTISITFSNDKVVLKSIQDKDAAQ